jgi:hypothetical protein
MADISIWQKTGHFYFALTFLAWGLQFAVVSDPEFPNPEFPNPKLFPVLNFPISNLGISNLENSC